MTLKNIAQSLPKFAATKAGKWALAGLAFVLASFLVIPLVKALPFVKGLTAGKSSVVVGLVLVALAIVAMYFLRNKIVSFVAGGVGVAGAVQAMTPVLAPLIGGAREKLAGVMA